jgi:hypothetical protein
MVAVALDAVVVVPIAVDAVEEQFRIIMARPMQQRDVCVPILAKMCLTTAKSLQQIKCAPYGKSLCIILASTMEKTLKTNFRTRFVLFSLSLCTPMMSC